jgi:DNA-directed RNA polymerase specialized sigma24 family protein
MEDVAVGIVDGVEDADASTPNATNESSFETFCRESYEPMVRLAFLLTSSQETAEDLVQDVLARTQPRWSKIDDPAAYVRRAVVNACNSHHRRRFRERAHPPREPELSSRHSLSEIAVDHAVHVSDVALLTRVEP